MSDEGPVSPPGDDEVEQVDEDTAGGDEEALEPAGDSDEGPLAEPPDRRD